MHWASFALSAMNYAATEETDRMTKTYRLVADAEHFGWLGVMNSRMGPLALLVEGRSLRDVWITPEVERVIDDELPAGDLGDFPFMAAVPTLSGAAVSALQGIIGTEAEFLPVSCPEGEFYVLNVLNVVDALDESASVVRRYSDGRIMDVIEPVFRVEKVAGSNVFKIPQTPRAPVFVTQAFVDSVSRAGLRGFRFDAVEAR